MHHPITPFPITSLTITALLPIDSASSSRQSIPDLVRPSSRRDGPGKLKGTTSRSARRLLLAVLVVALEGPHAVGLLLRVAAVYRGSGARQRVTDLVCAGVRGDAAC